MPLWWFPKENQRNAGGEGQQTKEEERLEGKGPVGSVREDLIFMFLTQEHSLPPFTLWSSSANWNSLPTEGCHLRVSYPRFSCSLHLPRVQQSPHHGEGGGDKPAAPTMEDPAKLLTTTGMAVSRPRFHCATPERTIHAQRPITVRPAAASSAWGSLLPTMSGSYMTTPQQRARGHLGSWQRHHVTPCLGLILPTPASWVLVLSGEHPEETSLFCNLWPHTENLSWSEEGLKSEAGIWTPGSLSHDLFYVLSHTCSVSQLHLLYTQCDRTEK